MSWKSKLVVLAVLGLPAFFGYPVTAIEAEIVAGVRLSWVLYALLIHAAILVLAGGGFAQTALAAAALICTPVVFAGAGISFLLQAGGGPAAYSAHYVGLCVTMLTVIPLALALIALVPFHLFEQTLLARSEGVGRIEKYALMFLRVFNHIVYSVIPGILEIVSEERRYRGWLDRQGPEPEGLRQKIRFRRLRLGALLRDMIQIGVEGICASIQYIPLWAVEISLLPGKRR